MRDSAGGGVPQLHGRAESSVEHRGNASMVERRREFQIFAKPAGALCNLECQYCYYLEKERLYPESSSFRMPDDLLEEFIVQQVSIAPGSEILFSWHGGEPTILGLDYFRRVVELQRKHCPAGKRIANGIQTNGVLLTDEWCRFLAAEKFGVGLSLDGPRELHDAYRATKDQKGHASAGDAGLPPVAAARVSRGPPVRGPCAERAAPARPLSLLQGDRCPVPSASSPWWSRNRAPRAA